MSAATALRRGRLVAVVVAAVVTVTAVVGALLGVGSSPGAYALTPTTGLTRADSWPVVVGPDASLSPEALQFQRPAPLPARSGSGKRVVFDMSEQRVWLVDEDDAVRRTYPVSGSRYDNLDPGSYEVYSRSEQAYAFDGSGSMRYMVRFTQGDNAAIGFHDIPVENGRKAQTKAELGTPQSHGCIRQWPNDAKALWRFAPLGTTVVVTA